MDSANLLKFVEPRWHKAFMNFIETGEAEEEFLAYINTNERCRQAVEMAFDTQASAFKNFAMLLKHV